MTRAKLESLVEDLIARTVEPCRVATKDYIVLDVDLFGHPRDVIALAPQTRMAEGGGDGEVLPAFQVEAPAVGRRRWRGCRAPARSRLDGCLERTVLLLDVTPLSLGIATSTTLAIARGAR